MLINCHFHGIDFMPYECREMQPTTTFIWFSCPQLNLFHYLLFYFSSTSPISDVDCLWWWSRISGMACWYVDFVPLNIRHDRELEFGGGQCEEQNFIIKSSGNFLISQNCQKCSFRRFFIDFILILNPHCSACALLLMLSLHYKKFSSRTLYIFFLQFFARISSALWTCSNHRRSRQRDGEEKEKNAINHCHGCECFYVSQFSGTCSEWGEKEERGERTSTTNEKSSEKLLIGCWIMNQ